MNATALQRVTRKAANEAWVDRAVRVGLATRGFVYLVLAYLVARIAAGALGGSSTNKPASGPGVVQALVAEPGGHIVLIVLAIGLLLYAFFSLIDAILHHDDESPAAKRWGDRVLSAWGFVLFAIFSGYAFHTAVSSSNGKDTAGHEQQQKTQWSARVLRWPVGWLWLGLLGLVLFVITVFLVSRAARRSFQPRLNRDEMSPRAWRMATIFGTVGYLGRAGLFGIVGWFVTSAAIENDPRHGQGVDGSVRLLADSAAGPAVLALLAATLGGYAAYLAFEVRYRRV